MNIRHFVIDGRAGFRCRGPLFLVDCLGRGVILSLMREWVLRNCFVLRDEYPSFFGYDLGNRELEEFRKQET